MSNPTGARGYWEPGSPPAPKRGLFSVANIVDVSDLHLLMGAEYSTNRCTQGQAWIDLCAAPNTGTKEFQTLDMVYGDPFTVYDALECPLVGATQEDYAAKLRDTFNVKAEAVAEAQLQALIQDSGWSVITSASLTDMIADLEEQLAEGYAGQGLLHMDRHSALTAASRNALRDPEDVNLPARTISGTPVVLGRGYEQNPDNYWAAATGQVNILRGPLLLNTAPPMADSPPRVLAEQTMVLLVECVTRYAESVIA